MFANFGLVLASSYSSVAPPEILNECLDYILGLLSLKGLKNKLYLLAI